MKGRFIQPTPSLREAGESPKEKQGEMFFSGDGPTGAAQTPGGGVSIPGSYLEMVNKKCGAVKGGFMLVVCLFVCFAY